MREVAVFSQLLKAPAQDSVWLKLASVLKTRSARQGKSCSVGFCACVLFSFRQALRDASKACAGGACFGGLQPLADRASLAVLHSCVC